jgi:hypothetical protein
MLTYFAAQVSSEHQFEALRRMAAAAVATHLEKHPASNAYSRPATWLREAWDSAIEGKSTVDAQLGTARVTIPQVHAIVSRLGCPPVFIEVFDHFEKSEGLVQFRVHGLGHVPQVGGQDA